MGRIKKLKNNELVGGKDNTSVYPITSTKAVYDENNVSQDYLNKHITGDRIENNTITGDKLEDKALTEEKVSDTLMDKINAAAHGVDPAYGLFITENNITWQGNSLLTTNSDYVTRTTTQTISGTKTFSANVTAKSFVKTGGTSSQFLKADGSVDSNTYLTSYTETDPTVPAWAKASTKPTYTAAEVGALQLGDYYAD